MEQNNLFLKIKYVYEANDASRFKNEANGKYTNETRISTNKQTNDVRDSYFLVFRMFESRESRVNNSERCANV